LKNGLLQVFDSARILTTAIGEMNLRVGLAEKAIVESEIFTRGHAVAFARQSYGSTVQLIIVSPVFKLLSNAPRKKIVRIS